MLVTGKIVVFGILAFVALVAIVIYLPIALIREVSRSEHEALPMWMGTVKGRRARLRVMIAILGVITLAIAVVAALER
jgi:hypothetical protein